MSPHIVVWLDYTEACISGFDRAQARSEVIKSYAIDPQQCADAAQRSTSRAPQTACFFNDIVEQIRDAQAILIVGPGFERLELMMHMANRFPDVAEKVVALESVDHPNDDEMVPWARKHFLNSEMVC